MVLGLVAYGVWAILEGALGDAGALTRLLAVGPAITAGLIAYWAAVTALRVPEAKQIGDFVMARVKR